MTGLQPVVLVADNGRAFCVIWPPTLLQVIQLTRELCKAQPEDAVAQQSAAPQATVVQTDTGVLLPPQMADQILHAQQRAALAGQGPADWAVGARCRAVHSGDGNWYNGVVESVTSTGRYVVAFDGYDSREEVGSDAVQLRATQDEDGYKGKWAQVAAR